MNITTFPTQETRPDHRWLIAARLAWVVLTVLSDEPPQHRGAK